MLHQTKRKTLHGVYTATIKRSTSNKTHNFIKLFPLSHIPSNFITYNQTAQLSSFHTTTKFFQSTSTNFLLLHPSSKSHPLYSRHKFAQSQRPQFSSSSKIPPPVVDPHHPHSLLPNPPVEPIDRDLARAFQQLEPISLDLNQAGKANFKLPTSNPSSIPDQMDETMLRSMKSIQSSTVVPTSTGKGPITASTNVPMSATTTTTTTATTAITANIPSKPISTTGFRGRWASWNKKKKGLFLFVISAISANVISAGFAQHQWTKINRIFISPELFQQDIIGNELHDVYQDIENLSSIYRCEIFRQDPLEQSRELFDVQKLILKHTLIQQQLYLLIEQSLEQIAQYQEVYGKDPTFRSRIAPYGDELEELSNTFLELRRVNAQRAMEAIYLYHKRFDPNDATFAHHFFESNSTMNLYNHVIKSFEIIYRTKLDLRRAVNFMLYMNSIANNDWWNTAPDAMKHNFQGILSFTDELSYEQYNYPEGNNFYPFFENNSLLFKQFESFVKYSKKNNTSIIINSASLQLNEIASLTPPKFQVELIDHLMFPYVTMDINHPGSLAQPSSEMTKLTPSPDDSSSLGSLQKNSQFNTAKLKNSTVNINPDSYPKGTVGNQRDVPRTEWLYTPTPKLPSYLISNPITPPVADISQDDSINESIFSKFAPKKTKKDDSFTKYTNPGEHFDPKKRLSNLMTEQGMKTPGFDSKSSSKFPSNVDVSHLISPPASSLTDPSLSSSSSLTPHTSLQTTSSNLNHSEQPQQPQQPQQSQQIPASQRYLKNGQVLKSSEDIKQEAMGEIFKTPFGKQPNEEK